MLRGFGLCLRAALSFALVLALAGCITDPAPQRMDFSALASADHVRIVGLDAAGQRVGAREVSDKAEVAALYRVVDSRQDGWFRPWPKMPSGRWTVTFSRDGRELGAYRVGKNFLSSDGYVRNLATADQRDVLDLVQGRSAAH